MPAKPDWHPHRYLTWLYSPPSQRPIVGALCAIESEIYASVRPGLDHHVAHTRLQWWRDECERLAESRPAHPLTKELVAACASLRSDAKTPGTGTAPLPEAPAQARETSPLARVGGLVDTAVWDLASATFETRRELTAYCERWAAAMIETAAAACSAGGVIAGSHWRTLGAAMREIYMLTDVTRDARSGRLRVALDELEQAGVTPTQVATPPWPEGLSTLLRSRHQALRATLSESISAIAPENQPEQRGLLVWASLSHQLSLQAERALPNTLRPGRFDGMTDSWRAWRAARLAITGRFRVS